MGALMIADSLLTGLPKGGQAGRFPMVEAGQKKRLIQLYSGYSLFYPNCDRKKRLFIFCER